MFRSVRLRGRLRAGFQHDGLDIEINPDTDYGALWIDRTLQA